ncbi:MAG TPA: PIN domain-containing protein [Steroidobacteraceae bacterium]|nr:PIN domain-containing protein [Steroidobacteraceae bacterium]
MTALVFVDTNVLLYWRDRSEAAKHAMAGRWIDHLWRTRLGRTSVQVLNEYYVNLTRKPRFALPESDVWEQVRAFFAWEPQRLDVELLRDAHGIERQHRLSWWDALIVAAAQAQECAVLLTEDLQDGATFGGVTVRNPFTTRVEEVRATYAAVPTALPGYRGRGRPRTRAA